MANKRKRASKEANTDTLPSHKRSKKDTLATNGSAKTKSGKPLDKSRFTEHPNVDERKRELDLYNRLGSEDVADRIEAADAIVSGLLGDDCVPEPVLLRHLEKRLFRGLASGRNASRLGFSLVLTELLGQLFGDKDLASSSYPGLTFDKVLGILLEKTQAGGNVPGQEERDHYFGQLFGLECFVRSGILSDRARWLSVLELLLKLSSKKTWLKSQCGYVIVQAILQIDKELAETTFDKLFAEGFAKTPEGVGIWIAALDRFPSMKAPSQPWRHPLATTSLAALPVALKDSGRAASSEESGGKNQPNQGSWSAQLHFVWDLILAHYIKLSCKSADDAADQFKQFWNRVVDESFFSKNASESQKFSGFMIFQKILEGANEHQSIVAALFSKNFMVSLMNQAAKEDRYLHRAAIKALKGIESVVETTPGLLPTVVKELLGKHGAYNFDQRTNTKTLEKLLQHTTPATVKSVLKSVQLKDPSKSRLDEPKYYQALGHYLFKLASVPADETETDASGNSVPGLAINALTELAYSNNSVPENIKEALRSRSTSAFAKLVRRPEDFGHLCNAILSIEADINPDDEIASTVLPDVYERLKDLLEPEKCTDNTRAPRQALALLHAVGILQFYNQDPDVIDLFEELGQCYEKLENHDEDSHEGISEYLVEILLAMVARPSSLMRQVSQQVFEAFTAYMSEDALQLLFDPLSAEESAKGQLALFSTEDEDMMEVEAADGEESDEEQLDSDVEIVDLEDAGSEASDGGEDGSDDDEDEGEEEDKDDDGPEDPNQEALDALDNALAEVLGSHRLDQDKDADSAASDDGSDMTDSEMMAVDEKLAEIFKQRAKASSKKKEKQDAKGTVVNFKHRILDLLAIYVKKEAAVEKPGAAHATHVFRVLLPLLQLIRTTTTKPLANKAADIIQTFSKTLKRARSNTSTSATNSTQATASTPTVAHRDELITLLAQLLDEAGRDASHAFARSVSTACLAVASVACSDEEGEAAVFALYSATQRRWFRGSVRIQPAVFGDWLNWCQSHAATAAAAAEKSEKKETGKKKGGKGKKK
ncbi:DNA polymerase phi-domain-containing protein [Dichotomopilus funicola]|uniref:DNA polymerase phi-domain-containing protein n=1 Tax=Dichotomopilus funicola TaxID=1934379 RepID=A0AAN6V6E5_9PEZI|nr:DNA polymerase phi-domain-containing protein [Dichotomopilus funicola]